MFISHTAGAHLFPSRFEKARPLLRKGALLWKRVPFCALRAAQLAFPNGVWYSHLIMFVRAWKTCVRDVERVDRHAEYQLGRFFGIPLSLKAAAFAGRHEGGLCGEQAEQTGEQLCRRYLFGTLCGPQHQTADAHRKRARFCVGRRRYAAFPFVPLQGG